MQLKLVLPEEATRREKRKMKQTLEIPMLCDKQSNWGGKGGEKEGGKELRSGLV